MSWLDDCAKAARALTREKRQEFLDEIRKGKTIGQARTICGISFDAANGILRENIEKREIFTLRKEVAR